MTAARPKTFLVEVTQLVEVTLDESKFDESFMSEFRDSFYPFFDLVDHAKHLAQLQARGVENMQYHKPQFAPFVEGYGPISEFGIRARVIDTDIEEVRP